MHASSKQSPGKRAVHNSFLHALSQMRHIESKVDDILRLYNFQEGDLKQEFVLITDMLLKSSCVNLELTNVLYTDEEYQFMKALQMLSSCISFDWIYENQLSDKLWESIQVDKDTRLNGCIFILTSMLCMVQKHNVDYGEGIQVFREKFATVLNLQETSLSDHAQICAAHSLAMLIVPNQHEHVQPILAWIEQRGQEFFDANAAKIPQMIMTMVKR